MFLLQFISVLDVTGDGVDNKVIPWILSVIDNIISSELLFSLYNRQLKNEDVMVDLE